MNRLVWSEKGIILNKDELFSETNSNELFFPSLKYLSTCAGIEKAKVWFHKYEEECFYPTEKEAIKQCLDYSENTKEICLLKQRLKQIKQEGKE